MASGDAGGGHRYPDDAEEELTPPKPELVCTITDPGHVHRWDRCPGHSGEPTQNVGFADLHFRDAVTEWREELGYDPITGGEL